MEANKPQQLELPQPQQQTSKDNSFAAMAAAGNPAQEFTVLRNKTAPKAPKILKPLSDPNDQKVIIQLHPSTP